MNLDKPERHRAMLIMRLRGMTWREIGNELGVSGQAAHDWGKRNLLPALDAALSEAIAGTIRGELAAVGLLGPQAAVRGRCVDAVLAKLPKSGQRRKRKPTTGNAESEIQNSTCFLGYPRESIPCVHSVSDNTHYVNRQDLPTISCGRGSQGTTSDACGICVVTAWIEHSEGSGI